MKTTTNIVAFLIVLAVAGCAQQEEERAWNISAVSTRDIIVSVQAAGIIEPVTTVEIKSKASGEILAINADTGDVVEEGDLIVQIDKRTPRNALAQAEAELEAARARRDIARSQRNRSEKLFKSGTLNEVEYETSILEFANAKAEVVRAEVAVENARIALDDTEVRAPIAGTLIQRDVEKGQVISSPTMDVGGGTVLLQMANLRFVQVRALVDETDIGKIQPGQKAIVTVAAYPNQPFNGEVLKLEPKAEDEETVTLFAVIITIDNELGLLRPGMNAEVEVDIASRYDVAAIPAIALRTARDIEAAALFTGMDEDALRDELRGAGMEVQTVSAASGYADKGDSKQDTEGQGYQFGGRYWIFVMENNQPVPRYIQTGLTDLDYSEVVSGIESGEQILLLPSSDLILSEERFRKWMGDVVGVPGMKSED